MMSVKMTDGDYLSFPHHYIPGFTGNNCEEICLSNTFGQNCAELCDCKNGGYCNPINGACDCAEGFSGKSCETKCQRDANGYNCKKECDCEDSMCNTISKNCRIRLEKKGSASTAKSSPSLYIIAATIFVVTVITIILIRMKYKKRGSANVSMAELSSADEVNGKRQSTACVNQVTNIRRVLSIHRSSKNIVQSSEATENNVSEKEDKL